MKKNILLIIGICLFVSIAIWLFTSKKNKDFGYEVANVTRNTIIETVEASGTVNPVSTVNIGSQVSGMVSQIYVDYNSVVKKGQLLAQIDPSLFQAAVDRSNSDLVAAKANYQKLQATFEFDKKNYLRYKSLYKKNFVSKSDLDLAEATYKGDLAQLSALKATISQASANLQSNLTNLRYTKIISPVDGVVVSRNVDVGQTVAASFQTPTLFMVAQDLNKMQIEVNVSEADIGKIKTGQDVEYTLDGYPDLTLRGKVSQVRISPNTISNVVTYTVVVAVDNENQKLIPGMTANVSVITKKSENVLAVPTKAFRFSPEELTQGKKFKEQGIWVIKENKPQRINIKTGAKDSEFTEIISNEIQEGDRVLVGQKGKKQEITGQKPPMRMF